MSFKPKKDDAAVEAMIKQLSQPLKIKVKKEWDFSATADWELDLKTPAKRPKSRPERRSRRNETHSYEIPVQDFNRFMNLPKAEDDA